MSGKIGIIDYGVGNIKSVQNAILFNEPSTDVALINHPEDLKKCEKIILPGVGAFEDAIDKIKQMGFDDAIYDVVKDGKILLGICLGMQLLASKSYEFGEFEGLNLIEGEVLPFEKKITLSIPHMGWNEVGFNDNSDPLFEGIDSHSDFYFVHSYFYKCKDESNVIGETDYGTKFASAIRKDNVYGMQFHPEKSQRDGLKIIDSFLKLS